MSKITKTLFGGSDSRQSSKAEFGVRSTPYSSFSGDRLNLDPSIRGLQEESLTGVRGVIPGYSRGTSDVIANLRATRERLSGNQSPFIQARVNPLEQALTARRGELQRSISERGLGGSSFGEQAITGFTTDAERQLGDARALATQESLGAMTGIDEGTLQALNQQAQIMSSMYGIPLDVAKQRLEQELQAFGLGKSQVSEGTTSQENGIIPGLSGLLKGAGSYGAGTRRPGG